jgi:hypothetical protein
VKILYVIDSLGTGGAERDLIEALSRAHAHGITPTVAALRHRDEGVQDEVLRMGIDVRFIRTSNILTRAMAVRSLVRAERPDLVHTVLAQADIVGRLAAWGTGTPVLTSAVGTSDERPLETTPRQRGFRALNGWTARHLTSHVHANSKAVEADVRRRLGVPARRITTIENGRDPARLGEVTAARRRAARERLGLSDRDEVLVNTARQDYVKGQPFLVEAFAMCPSWRRVCPRFGKWSNTSIARCSLNRAPRRRWPHRLPDCSTTRRPRANWALARSSASATVLRLSDR